MLQKADRRKKNVKEKVEPTAPQVQQEELPVASSYYATVQARVCLLCERVDGDEEVDV